MKKLTLLGALCLCLSLTSCQRDYPIESFIEPTFRTNLPSYPLSHLYIIEREYGFFHSDNINLKRDDYIEMRLLELFPHSSFEGMMQEAKVEAQHYEQSYEQYLLSVNNYNNFLNIQDSSMVVEDYEPFVSHEQDVINLNLSKSEIDALAVWDNIAKAQLNKNQMDSAFQHLNRFWFNQVNSSYILIPLSITVKYSVFRILQSKNRADEKAEFYFPTALGSGLKGDAFRHVFVSMHLRRYLGRMGSAMVMSAYEYLNPNAHDSDKYMDLHNNRVGRGGKYWAMRGGYFKHRYDWERWALNAKNFINNSNNAVDMDWENGNLEECKSDADKVSVKKYIHYK